MSKKLLWSVCKFLFVAVVVHILTIKYGQHFYPTPKVTQATEEETSVSQKDLEVVHIIAFPEGLTQGDEQDEAYARAHLVDRRGHTYNLLEKGTMLNHRGFMFKLRPSPKEKEKGPDLRQ